MKKLLCVLIMTLSILPSVMFSYAIRAVNLGTTNFLDGLPVPAGKGWYIREYYSYFTANRFADGEGNTIGEFGFRSHVIVSQLIYQSDVKLLGGKLGGEVLLPLVLSFHLDANNPLMLTHSGAGFDDLLIGPFIQWAPFMLHGRPFMANRIEFDVTFPTGKYQEEYSINPGFNHYSIEPYWAATIFLMPKWTVSWRFHYLINTRNFATGIRGGSAIHLNFATSVAIIPHRLRIGLAGYYLKQLNNDTFHDTKIPNSREQIFAVGPGFMYIFSKKTAIFFNTYFEGLAKSRPEGARYIFNITQFLG